MRKRWEIGLYAAVACAALAHGCGPAVCTEMCAPLTMTVEIGYAPNVAVVAPGATVPWVHGFQGGTMVQPVIVLDASQVAEGDLVEVTITHMPDPAAPGALGEAAGFPRFHAAGHVSIDDTGRYVVLGLADQLGYGPLDGVRMIYGVDVATRTRRATLSAAITLMAPPSGP